MIPMRNSCSRYRGFLMLRLRVDRILTEPAFSPRQPIRQKEIFPPKPLGSNEAAWAQNRRAVTVVIN